MCPPLWLQGWALSRNIDDGLFKGFCADIMKAFINALGCHHREKAIVLNRLKSSGRYMLISAESIHVLLLQRCTLAIHDILSIQLLSCYTAYYEPK
jgi:hypothetical protein